MAVTLYRQVGKGKTRRLKRSISDVGTAPPVSLDLAPVALKKATHELKMVLGRWEAAYSKQNFY